MTEKEMAILQNIAEAGDDGEYWHVVFDRGDGCHGRCFDPQLICSNLEEFPQGFPHHPLSNSQKSVLDDAVDFIRNLMKDYARLNAQVSRDMEEAKQEIDPFYDPVETEILAKATDLPQPPPWLPQPPPWPQGAIDQDTNTSSPVVPSAPAPTRSVGLAVEFLTKLVHEDMGTASGATALHWELIAVIQKHTAKQTN